MQVIIWWAGLIRGAVSIALAFKQACVFFLLQLHLNILCITVILECYHFNIDSTLYSLYYSKFLSTREVHILWCHVGSNKRNDDHKHHNSCSLQHTGMQVVFLL